MPMMYTVTEYDKEDIEKLDDMTKEDVIETLEGIKRGWLPTDCVYGPREGATYSESQYRTTKLHVAMGKAIEMLNQKGD